MRFRGLAAALALLAMVAGFGCDRIKRRIYEPPDRDSWQHPEQVIQSLGLKAGQHVADLGAGGGYFTFRLTDAVGPKGRVYALDIDPGMTRFLDERAHEEGYTNVEVILGEAADSKLPDGAVDMIFTCNTYHHLADRSAYFTRIKESLTAEGRVAIIDHKPEGWFQWIFPHSSLSEDIRREMEAAGYELEVEHEFLPKQSFLIFRRE